MPTQTTSGVLRRLRRDEGGMALISVIGVAVLLAILISTVATSALNAHRTSHVEEDWHGALAAAEAGIDHYIHRLNNPAGGTAYWQYSSANPDPDNPAFTSWVDVPGTSASAQFTYDVHEDISANLTNPDQTGAVTLQVHGRMGAEVRRLDVEILRDDFSDYLYFTDYETNANFAPEGTDCEVYFEDGRSNDCMGIVFGTGERMDGKVHSNDALLIQGSPVFTQEVTTGYDGGGTNYRASGTPTPTFEDGAPRYVGKRVMPPTNTQLRAQADPVLGADGCLFDGPTVIRLEGDLARVKSPLTVDAGPCGATFYGNGFQTISLDPGSLAPGPDNGVIYVQGLPSDHPDAACIVHPLGLPDGQEQLLPVSATNSRSYWRRMDTGPTITPYPYGCAAGDVFVSGQLDGQLTVASEKDLYVVGDLTYVDGNDVLGLVANGLVEVYNPVGSCTYQDTIYESKRYVRNADCTTLPVDHDRFGLPGVDAKLSGVHIEAAILSVQNSFTVQNWWVGDDLGTLDVDGAITQKFRGTVGYVGGSGYAKDYAYDLRLRQLTPPYYLTPEDAAWTVQNWSEERVDTAALPA